MAEKGPALNLERVCVCVCEWDRERLQEAMQEEAEEVGPAWPGGCRGSWAEYVHSPTHIRGPPWRERNQIHLEHRLWSQIGWTVLEPQH